tara:strand:- start:5232 stop:5504 length:273 start_codon:yes stop_codon:yes gene_type:complete
MSEENKNQNSDWRNREIGALWKKDGKSQKFYSGFIKLNKGTPEETEESVVIFVNKFKEKSADNAPDLIIYKSEKAKSLTNHDDIPDSFIS